MILGNLLVLRQIVMSAWSILWSVLHNSGNHSDTPQSGGLKIWWNLTSKTALTEAILGKWTSPWSPLTLPVKLASLIRIECICRREFIQSKVTLADRSWLCIKSLGGIFKKYCDALAKTPGDSNSMEVEPSIQNFKKWKLKNYFGSFRVYSVWRTTCQSKFLLHFWFLKIY